MITLELSNENAQLLKNVLHAVYKTFRIYKGMNTGSSQVHNLYWTDVEKIISIHDSISFEHDSSNTNQV